MKSSRVLLALTIFALAAGVLALLALRPGEQGATPRSAGPAAARARPVSAPVMIEAMAVQIPASALVREDVASVLAMLPEGGTGVVQGSQLADRLAALGASGPARILARPRLLVLSGQPARLLVSGAAADEKDSLEVSVNPTAREDGSVTLGTQFTRTTLNGQLEIIIDGLGVPIGTSGAGAELHLDPGATGVLSGRVRDGDRLVILLSASVPQPPAPGPQ